MIMLEMLLHQLHDNLKSLRFQAGVVALLAFFAANGAVYVLKADRVATETERLESENARRYDSVTDLGTAVDQDFRFLLRPLGTEFIAEGGAHWFEDTGVVNASTGQGIGEVTRRAAVNNWMDSYELLDWVLIARVVLSFLALVLAYDAFSGERETGTLSMILANSVSRVSLLLAKFGAHLASLTVALVLAIIVNLLVLSLSQAVTLDVHIVGAAGLFLVSSMLYCALFLLLALGVSCLARTSASSLVVLVLTWAVLIVALPQAAYLIGFRTVPAPNWQQIEDHRQQLATNLSNEGIVPRGREVGQADDFAVERQWADRMREEERALQQMYRTFRDQEVRQFEVTSRIALLSPGYAFQQSVEAVLGTGLVRQRAFSRASWDYVDVLRDFIRTRDAADSESPHILFVSDYVSQQPLDGRDIPRFPGVRLSFTESVAGGWLPLALLLLEMLAAYLFAVWAVRRAPVVDRG